MAFALLLAACAVPDGTPQAAPEEPKARSIIEEKLALQCEPGKEHWRSEGTPKRGGAFRYPQSAPHLDLTAPGLGGRVITPQVYNFLVKPRACYYEDVVMEPDLAKSWQISPDRLTWTLKLRDDARWHNKAPMNGRAFTSADVGWTIDYQKQGGGVQSFWEDVAHEEPDAHTVVLRFKQPDPDFLGKLGYDNNPMMPREVKEQFGDYKAVAIGTGPYMLKDYRRDDRVVLERNPDWKELGADGRPLPYIDEIHVLNIVDYAAHLAAFRSGQLEMNPVSGGFLPSHIEDLRRSMRGLTYYLDTVAGNWGLWFKHTKKPLDDPRVRKALSFAFSRDDIVARNEGSAVYCGFVPCGLLDYAWTPEKAKQKYRHDPDEARRLLREAGFAPGQLRFTLRVSMGLNQLDAELVQHQLRETGIETEMIVEAGSAPIGTVLPRPETELFYGGPTVSFLPDYWAGSVVRTGGAQNYMGFSDPKVDALSRAQAREFDPVKRKQIIDELQDHLYDLMPYAPTINRIYHRQYGCGVKNMRATHQSRNLEGLDKAWVDTAGC